MLWKEKYKLGVKLIDEQHEELFKRVEDFVSILRSSKSQEEKEEKIIQTLEFMKDYVIIHFRDEEIYQKEIGYPEHEAHAQKHRDMVQYVAEVEAKYRAEGYNEQLLQQFGGRLLAWLINHVAAEDVKIADFAREKEVI